MRVYKVVERHYGILQSCWSMDEFCVTYTPGKAAKAPVGKLFAFRSLNDARRFLSHLGGTGGRGSHLMVWEAEASGVQGLGKIINYKHRFYGMASRVMRTYVQAFWDRNWAKARTSASHSLSLGPKGTVLCDTITLVMEVG